ncbi:MAG: hypothetical protein EAX96_14290 [Candidatus Lokiarchaeota archaeon]|nr:hypothetical protein [Candidatus Lokiarchaeota archaeon]
MDKKVENENRKSEEELTKENSDEIKKKQEIEEEMEPKDKTYDQLGLIFFIGFIFCVFYIIFSQLMGLYPFQIEGELIGGTFIGSGRIFLANPVLLYIIYWIGLAFLLLGFYRIKWEPQLIILIGIIGALIFFAFFIRIYY